ncbi:DUF4396 domain-containing protein [Porphyrobacter algicida]|uniref:DUF4396 domain-containing protein n=1 Tax=Qipengyuania algicida TaxID=1836209 RepID=A0A845ALA1_9SPHN|nr:DUF4396 domain-containing protein [Qipengyuania algicida]MXP29661.1 DUF4396 domain-containing protein [Qipengyuania algicida]
MSPAFPAWLHLVSIIAVGSGFVCATTIALDEVRRPQRMWIMNLVWLLTALFGSVLWLAIYYRWGRTPADPDADQGDVSFPVMVAKGSSHCGAGCTLGDIIIEWAVFAFPAIAVWFGWQSWFEDKIFAIWIPDFLLAFLIGVVFQYFTIKPMRDLSVGGGIWAAVKADTASISSWQIGMYGVMALIQFVWFKRAFGGTAEVNTPEFWFAMQLAMLGGFVTSYPVNWMLIRIGWKEKM